MQGLGVGVLKKVRNFPSPSCTYKVLDVQLVGGWEEEKGNKARKVIINIFRSSFSSLLRVEAWFYTLRTELYSEELGTGYLHVQKIVG